MQARAVVQVVQVAPVARAPNVLTATVLQVPANIAAPAARVQVRNALTATVRQVRASLAITVAPATPGVHVRNVHTAIARPARVSATTVAHAVPAKAPSPRAQANPMAIPAARPAFHRITPTPAVSMPSTARVARARPAPGPAARVRTAHVHRVRARVVRNPAVIAGRVGVGSVVIVDS